MIHYLPLENLHERYTITMNNQLKELTDYYYYPELDKITLITKGEFLDIEKTIEFKSKQLALVSAAFQNGLVKNGDVFLVADIFYPGIESIKYMAELQDINIEIVGYNHAGRADKNDFVRKLGQWSDIAEKTYLTVADKICVGSEYHKKLICDYFDIDRKKIFVTGCVWSNKIHFDIYPHYETKEDIVIYPHRICKEKGFDEFISIAELTPEIKYLITTSGKIKEDLNLPKNISYKYCSTKAEYYYELSKAKYYLSTAHQETFGYTLREALLYNCIPIVPNRAAYLETVPEENRYKSIEEALYLLKNAKILSTIYLNKYNDNAKTIIELCKERKIGTEKK